LLTNVPLGSFSSALVLVATGVDLSLLEAAELGVVEVPVLFDVCEVAGSPFELAGFVDTSFLSLPSNLIRAKVVAATKITKAAKISSFLRGLVLRHLVANLDLAMFLFYTFKQ
jgi:hypothetical protein